MKLRYLSMTAFGPYRKTAEINFESFYEDGIFLIRGATGSGKTSILDALTFVFYDESSGGERGSWKNFRCQYSDPDTPTKVYCDVELQSGSYRFEVIIGVTAKRDGTFDLKSPEHMIYRLVEEETSPLSAGGSAAGAGLVALAPRFTRKEAEDKAAELIGLTREQFCQVVLLPQGQFGRFLTAESQKKEAILNSIFKTERYSLAAAYLSEQANLRKKELRGLDERLQIMLSQAEVNSIEELDEKVKKATTDLKNLQEKLQAANLKVKASQSAYAAGEQLAEAYSEQGKLKKEKTALEQTAEQAQADKNRLELGQKAAEVLPFLQHCETVRKRLEKGKLELAACAAEQKKAKLVWTSLKEREEAYRAAGIKAEQLKAFLPLLEIAVKNRLEEKRLCEQDKRLLARLEELQKEQADWAGRIDKIDRALEGLSDGADKRSELQALEARLKLKEDQAERAASDLVALRKAYALRQEGKQVACDLAFALKKAKQRYEELLTEQNQINQKTKQHWLHYFQKQAENEGVCPVCGKTCSAPISAGHLSYLTSRLQEDRLSSADDRLAEQGACGEQADQLGEAIREAQDKVQSIKLQAERRQSDLDHTEETIDRLVSDLSEMGHKLFEAEVQSVLGESGREGLDEDGLTAGSSGSELDLESFASHVQLTLRALEERIQKKADELSELENRRQGKVAEKQKLEDEKAKRERSLQQCLQEKALVEGRLAELDQKGAETRLEEGAHYWKAADFRQAFFVETQELYGRSQAALEDMNGAEADLQLLKQLKKLSDALSKDFTDYQAALSEAERGGMAAEAAFKAAQAVIKEQEQALKKAETLKNEQVQKSGESEMLLLASYLPDEEISRLSKYLSDREALGRQLDLRLAVLAEKTSRQTPPDLEGLLAAKNKAEENLKYLQEENGRMSGDLERLSRLLEQVFEVGKDLDKQRAEAEELADFSDLVGGKRGLSLQRFVLQQMLFRVIQEANQLLEHVHNGRYRLTLTDDKQGREQKTGLNFNVYDYFTEEERGVATLSGGEKFLVSLALSLALSAVVQLSSGGIRIQSMFVDEGFGALDEESLAEAMEMLIRSKTSDRLVGIISHVKDIQALVPQVLEVVKTDKGSYLAVRS